MKTLIAGILALAYLGAGVVLPGISVETLPYSTSAFTESAGAIGSLPEDGGESEAMPDSGVPDTTSLPDPATGRDSEPAESGVEPAPDPGEDAGTDTDAEPAGVMLSGEYAVQLAGEQAGSIMGFHGMECDAGCAQAIAVISLAEYLGATEDEAYFYVWETLNAAIAAQATKGVAAANCVFADGQITIYV